MKRQAVKMFSGYKMEFVENNVNKFLSTIDAEDIVSISNSQVDNNMDGTGLRAQNFYVYYTVTVVYTYDYTQKCIEDEIRELREEISRKVSKGEIDDDQIFLNKYKRFIHVNYRLDDSTWVKSWDDVIMNIFASDEYNALRQEIVDKWYAKDPEYNAEPNFEESP